MVFIEINLNYFEEMEDMFEGGLWDLVDLKIEDVKFKVVESIRCKVCEVKMKVVEVMCLLLKWGIFFCEFKKVGFLLMINF